MPNKKHKHINILRILRKTAKKILRILWSSCTSDSYVEEKRFPGRSPRVLSLRSPNINLGKADKKL